MRRSRLHDLDLAFYVHGVQHRRRKTRVERKILAGEPASAAYAGLHRASLSLGDVRVEPDAQRHVNLVLLDLRPDLVFAGLNTAMLAAQAVCVQLGMPLRIVVLNVRPSSRTVADILRVLGERCSEVRSIQLVYQVELRTVAFAASDVWMPTFWVTAHALDVAARLGLVSPEQVLYLVQDYEPSFFPASTEGALARSTYHAGFAHIVNSSPLARYLEQTEGVVVPAGQVFSPQLDLERLATTAAARTASKTVRILFYGRPSKPRNMFSIGVTALRLAAQRLEDEGIVFEVVSAGEPHGEVRLTRIARMASLGRLSWDAYFDRLSRVDVVLSLQATPHPSHPPLDGVVSGAVSVTNEVEGTRSALHERLIATDPRPATLADALVQAATRVREEGAGAFAPGLLPALGVDLSHAVTHAARMLQ